MTCSNIDGLFGRDILQRNGNRIRLYMSELREGMLCGGIIGGPEYSMPILFQGILRTPPAQPLPPEPSSASSEPQPDLTPPGKLPFFKSSRRKLLEEKVEEMLATGPIDDKAALELAS